MRTRAREPCRWRQRVINTYIITSRITLQPKNANEVKNPTKIIPNIPKRSLESWNVTFNLKVTAPVASRGSIWIHVQHSHSLNYYLFKSVKCKRFFVLQKKKIYNNSYGLQCQQSNVEKTDRLWVRLSLLSSHQTGNVSAYKAALVAARYQMSRQILFTYLFLCDGRIRNGTEVASIKWKEMGIFLHNP